MQEGQYETSVPTVRDRVVQAAAKIVLEPVFEADFMSCSYGFRPRRSALDAVAVCRERCFKNEWAIDLDIAKFLDIVPHCSFR